MRNDIASKSMKRKFEAATLTSLLLLGFATSFANEAFAKGPATKGPVDVVIFMADGGHSTAAQSVAQDLENAGMTYAFIHEVDIYQESREEVLASQKNYVARFVNDAAAMNRSENIEASRRGRQRNNSISDTWFGHEGFSKEKIVKLLDLYQPKVIESTYWLANSVVKAMEEDGYLKNIPVGRIDSDYGTSMWTTVSFVRDVDMTFAPTPEYRRLAIERGADPNKIIVTGIPPNQSVYQTLQPAQVDRLRSEIGLSADTSIPTVFLGGGSFGVGKFEDMIWPVVNEFKDRPIQIVVATSKSVENAALIKALAEKMPSNVKLVGVGFRPDMPMVIKYLADVVITKAGGLSTTEMNIMRKKMVLLKPATHLERANLRYMERNGLALASTYADLGKAVDRLLTDKRVADRILRNQIEETSHFDRLKIVEWTQKVIHEQETGVRQKPRIIVRPKAPICKDLFKTAA